MMPQMSSEMKAAAEAQAVSRAPLSRSVVDRFVLPARRVGPATVGVLVVGLAVLWSVVGPSDGSWSSFLGQLAGAEAILLMSIALVLISTLPWVETWFDGIDRAAIWHRRLVITGMILLIPHVTLAASRQRSSWGSALANISLYGLLALVVWAILPRWRSVLPRAARRVVAGAEAWAAGNRVAGGVLAGARWLLGDYERWRAVHRMTGLFVAAGFVHGLADSTAFGSRLLRWIYVGIGGIGLVVYVYRETVAKYFLPLHDYQVAEVARVGPGLAEIGLTPIGPSMQFVPGQFAMLFLEGKNGWRRHPFTMASAPHDGVLRFTIKSLGDDTAEMHHTVQPGMPAVVGGPHGRFVHTHGTDDQIWIAGGIGITPFLSWLRALDRDPVRGQVALYYANAGAAPFAEEITAIAADHDNIHLHLVDTSSQGRLTPDQILAENPADPRRLSVFLCGPRGMVQTFTQRFRRAGVAPRNLHREHFDWR
jgi:predicted ferric reductase